MAEKKNSSFIFLLIAMLIVAAVYTTFLQEPVTKDVEEVGISEIQTAYENGDVKEISIEGNTVKAELNSGEMLKAIKGPQESVADLGFTRPDLVPLSYKDLSGEVFWTELALSIIPIVFIIGIIFFMMRSVSAHNRTAMGFGSSKAKEFKKDDKKKKTTFADVAGSDNAKEELVEIVDFLKSPKKYLKMGAKIPKGVLMFGPPGTGKTLMARAVAGEADVPFFSISGSEFVEMFVGVGASRVRDLFAKARKNSPCIVFIDEIDAVGRHRGAGLGGGHDEREQTLNQILSEMDGFEKDNQVIVIAATNRPDVLDPALLRPGRFDRRVTVGLPDILEREAILNVHARKKPFSKKAKLTTIARHTPGFSGADLENLLNEAAILAAKNNKTEITQKHLEKSVEKVMMGPEKKSKVLSDLELRITAFHEVGHAITGHVLPHTDPVHKISIVARGMALGVTWFLPEKDQVLVSELKFKDQMVSLMGGHAAEELIFGSVTTGASNDLEKASNIARSMVTRYGMSQLGPIIYGEHHGNIFLGKDIVHERNYSEETAKSIDDEVHRIILEAMKKANSILVKHRELLNTISEDLIVKETLSKEEFEKYFIGMNLTKAVA